MIKQIAAVLLAIPLISCEKKTDNDLLEELLSAEPENFSHLLRNKDAFEIQIIYTKINRDEHNTPTFMQHTFNANPERYFYPASTVKLPLVLLALEKVNRLRIPGLNAATPMLHDSCYNGQISVSRDTTSPDGFPSIAHYSRKILVVSDNDAFNRLYEFMGQEATNAILREKGFNSIRIIHRLERPLSRDENRHTEAVRFISGEKVVWQQPMLVAPPFDISEKVFRGKGFVRNDSVIRTPFDFTYKNFYSLFDQQEMLKTVLFPEAVPEEARFDLTTDQRRFVMQYMSQLPRETSYPPYYRDTSYYDAYCKFLLFGNSRERIPDNIRIFNKVGDAYGYLIDNAYVVDFSNNIEFILSAVINTNIDSIYNDGKYAYDSLGYPFMRALGQAVYHYELRRERKFTPDLSAFKMSYDR